ncbi:Dilute domain-containing protein C25B8.08 [Psilocybe cubensis]|uniref:Dilute domain-containing protein C25B8.08 n=2 Tax=Psilocybe cubensis TaxID=181762 RepID=A0ACB8HH42_PSICU|nr:Dilute domain-containing protein C25B8.08 [Psilocybe cubensis]KAH9487020.1 Dilute domain-containing protein C25B8.08 [Psilocybe cubensis]
MPAVSAQPIDLTPEPDLHPLYPTVSQISEQLGPNSGLDPSQKAELVAHCLTRACAFGDITVVQHLLTDPQAQAHVNLGLRDEDGVNLISLTICGFGGDSDRDIEREECVRLLVSQGADMTADKAGWTPLHYAAILSPPTLVSYLMTHGCSPFAVTERKLTPLDIVTAHSTLPGKEDVALLLEEAMRGEGWTGGRMEERRRVLEQRSRKKSHKKEIREGVGKILGVNPDWWGKDSDISDEESDSDEEEEEDDGIYTPRPDYSSMLVFSPPLLAQIFESLITNYQPTFKDSTPANTLYLLARFAALTCDHTWLEDLIIGATDAIEETFFNRAEDLSCLVFWLYNTTVWLHLLECDTSINEACEMLGSFELIEEVINSVFVFIIRFAERRIDQLLDSAILSYTPVPSELEAVQFESEWSFLRPFAGKRKTPSSPIGRNPIPPSPTPASPHHRPLSPSQSQSTVSSSGSRGYSSLRQTITRARGLSSAAPPLSSVFLESHPPSPFELTSFLTSLHMLLILSDINPAIITQLWSQVMYWTACEIFNRVITRKKYICRSRAVQISMNLTVIEEWIEEMGIPPGIQSHFAPVRDLLNWLQRLSSIAEFPDLVATIQTMKSINPLQMRRAVRDYKYEVNEGRMTEECIQYLTQLQKDWERHRVKLGVEAIRKEITERDRDRDQEGSISSLVNEAESSSTTPSIAPSVEALSPQQNIDILFDKRADISLWEPVHPPQALGELLDSRHMLPLLFPSDPRLLAALPAKKVVLEDTKRESVQSFSSSEEGRTGATPLHWISRNRKVREVSIGTLKWVDGVGSASRWGRPVDHDYEPEEQEHAPRSFPPEESEEPEGDEALESGNSHATPLTRKPSGRTKGRQSMGETTPIETSFDSHVFRQ